MMTFALMRICAVILLVSGRSLSMRNSKGVSIGRSIDVPGELAKEIEMYLACRPEQEIRPREYSIAEQDDLRKQIAGPQNDIVPELKQTGWYRDPREEDEKKRFDKSAPLVSHPLSFRELEKYGYSHLVKPILELGGPYLVGEAVGYIWVEPTFEVDESRRPERKESYAMDMNAELSVGSSLDGKLEKAAELDLNKLKRDIENKRRNKK